MQQMQQVLHRAQPYRRTYNHRIINELLRLRAENATDAARKKCCSVGFAQQNDFDASYCADAASIVQTGFAAGMYGAKA